MTKQSNVSVVAKGGVSGYVNVSPEIKQSPNGVDYLQILLGRGKKKDSEEFLPAYSIMAYGNVAKLMAATLQKGDLIRVTKMSIAINKDDNFKKYNIASSFSIVVEEFEKIILGQQQERAPQTHTSSQKAQPTMQEMKQEDDFKDDIPF